MAQGAARSRIRLSRCLTRSETPAPARTGRTPHPRAPRQRDRVGRPRADRALGLSLPFNQALLPDHWIAAGFVLELRT
jgi:hypothetical protein